MRRCALANTDIRRKTHGDASRRDVKMYRKLTSIDAKLSASKKKSHNLEHQQENKHEQSEYLFSPDVTATKSESAKHGNGKAVGFWHDK